MADDTRAQIVLDGDVSPLRQKLREAAEELKRLGNDGSEAFNKMTGPLGALYEKFLMIGTLLAGGALFKEAITDTVNFYVHIEKMARTMGISEEAAIALKIALGDIYVDAATFESAMAKLIATTNTAPEKFERFGIALKDEITGKARNGQEILLDTVGVINEFKEGTDRSRMAAYYFGKNWMEVSKILELNRDRLQEATEKARALGISLNADEIKEYRAQMNDVNDVFEAINIRIGGALIPTLTGLAKYFNEIGGPVVNALIWGFKHLIQFLDETVTMIRLVWNDTKYVFDQLTTAAGQMGASLAAILQGNVSDAKAIWAEGNLQIEKNEAAHLAEFERLNKEHAERIVKLWEPVSIAKGGKKATGGSKTAPTDLNEKKDGPEKSEMAYYENLLGQKKNLASQENALREYSKAQELAYWETILGFAQLSANDRLAVEKKVLALSVEVRHQEAKLKQDIDSENDRSAVERALARIDAEQAAMEALLATDDITKQQALSLEQQYEQRRYDIKRSALIEKLALYDKDPELNPLEMSKIKNQLLELEMQYQVKKTALQGKELVLQKQEADKSNKIWESLGHSVSSLWDKGVNAMMNGTLRWSNATKAIGLQLASWFANSVVGEMVKTWLAGKAKQLAISLGFMAEEKGAQVIGSAQIVDTKIGEATSVASANAVEAGTGAASSQAGIPIVGPILALAAMAAVFAAVSAMGSRIKSASKGYAVPKGMNPMMQIHEEEVVLPSDLSKGIKQLIETGGSGSGGSTFAPSISIHALDSRDVRRALQKDGVLHKELKRMHRDFVR